MKYRHHVIMSKVLKGIREGEENHRPEIGKPNFLHNAFQWNYLIGVF